MIGVSDYDADSRLLLMMMMMMIRCVDFQQMMPLDRRTLHWTALLTMLLANSLHVGGGGSMGRCRETERGVAVADRSEEVAVRHLHDCCYRRDRFQRRRMWSSARCWC